MYDSLEKMCGKAERKVEFNSDDYLMLLASTGQPSFYSSDGESPNTPEEEEEEEEEKIFNFH